MELKTTIEEKNNRKEAYNNMRKDRVDKIKEDKKLYQKKKLLNLKQIERKALEKKEMIKAQNIQGRLKIKEFFEKKKEKFQEEYQLEMTGEERMKFRKEMEILKMEKLEMDLITKLQSSQVLQKNAYEELENALMLPARDFEKKYIIAPKENAQQIETESQNLSKEIPQQKSEEISIIKNNNNEENSKMKKEILESKELVKEKTEQNKKKDDGEDKLEKDVKEQVEIEEKPIKEENIIEKNNKEEEKGELKEKS